LSSPSLTPNFAAAPWKSGRGGGLESFCVGGCSGTPKAGFLAPHLQVKTKIATGLRIYGDRDLLNQVLQNLLSNAIKYNLPEGWIQIEARQQGKIALITISNTSQNILTGDRNRLFERFYCGDLSRNREPS
jgi:signal transduction histidine kinase